MEDTGSTKVLSHGEIISGRYTVEKLLGSGGMGSVYVASDRVLSGQHLAIKILHSELVRDESLIKRFLREVELMHKVNHQNVVRTFDVGIDGSLVYFTMEFVVGTPLDGLLDDAATSEPLSIRRIAHIGMQIADGLSAIHQADILHRDLKPQNILILQDDTAKITDFGVARPTDSKLTQHQEILGSIHYMAPEVWMGQKLTPAVDLYALGIILYEMTTGVLPFDGNEAARMMWMHTKQPPKPPRAHRADTPNWLNQLILNLLQKSPEQRPKSARDVRAFLQANLDNSSHFIRAPEMMAVGRPNGSSSGLTITSSPTHHSLHPIDAPTVVYRAAETKKGIEKSWGWVLVVALLIFGVIAVPTKEICACTTMQDHILDTLGIKTKISVNANTIGPEIARFLPSSTLKTSAEKKLYYLAASQPNRCKAVENYRFRCRYVLREGLVRSSIFEVTLLYQPSSPDRVGDIEVRFFTEFFGIPIKGPSA